MKTIIIMLSASLSACCACPKKKPVIVQQHHQKHHSAHARAAAEGMSYVSPQWLAEYHQLEQAHGDYVIPDDHRIQAEKDGKIKVPHSVVKHFNDLSIAPTETP